MSCPGSLRSTANSFYNSPDKIEFRFEEPDAKKAFDDYPAPGQSAILLIKKEEVVQPIRPASKKKEAGTKPAHKKRRTYTEVSTVFDFDSMMKNPVLWRAFFEWYSVEWADYAGALFGQPTDDVCVRCQQNQLYEMWPVVCDVITKEQILLSNAENHDPKINAMNKIADWSLPTFLATCRDKTRKFWHDQPATDV